uniref:Uncharacterized protein n=1 Tax=Cacopsylla melanoneura TaxID=428564 RepID=A0A8D8QAA4_9HEMI
MYDQLWFRSCLVVNNRGTYHSLVLLHRLRMNILEHYDNTINTNKYSELVIDKFNKTVIKISELNNLYSITTVVSAIGYDDVIQPLIPALPTYPLVFDGNVSNLNLILQVLFLDKDNQSLGTTILNICDAYFKKNINVTTAGVITRIMDYVDWIPLIECDMSDQCSDMGPLKKMDIVNGLDISFRPCSIQSKYTIASGDDGFNFKYAKTNKIFQCPQFNLYVLPPMDLSSFDYGDSFSQLTMDKYKQKIISACTGLVMKGDVERNNHVGSCSLVRDGKRFYVKTNSHVINGSGQTKDISGKLTKYLLCISASNDFFTINAVTRSCIETDEA